MKESRKRQPVTKETGRLMIHLDMFYRDLLVVFGNEKQTRERLRMYFDKEEIDELLEGFSFREKGKTVYASKFNAFFVWIPEPPKTAQDVGFLVHELFHSTYAVMCNSGISLSEDSEEAFAYMIGYMTEKVLEQLPTFSCPSRQQ